MCDLCVAPCACDFVMVVACLCADLVVILIFCLMFCGGCGMDVLHLFALIVWWLLYRFGIAFGLCLIDFLIVVWDGFGIGLLHIVDSDCAMVAVGTCGALFFSFFFTWRNWIDLFYF